MFISRPIACYPVFNYPTVVCRFSSVRYKRPEGKEPGLMDLVGLPYYDVFALATTEEVFIFSTNQAEPLFYVTNIHYAQICDFAWYL